MRLCSQKKMNEKQEISELFTQIDVSSSIWAKLSERQFSWVEVKRGVTKAGIERSMPARTFYACFSDRTCSLIERVLLVNVGLAKLRLMHGLKGLLKQV